MSRAELIAALAKLLTGLNVPVSLGLPLGVAREAFDTIHADRSFPFGWADAEQVESWLNDRLSEPRGET